MNLRFLGANRQVTGSCYLLEAGGLRLLIDCGLFQERHFAPRNWDPFPEPVNTIDFLLLTHAHLDHCGRIPKIYKEGFNAPVICTRATADLARLVLLDTAHIQEEDAGFKMRRHEREGRRDRQAVAPLYTPSDAEAALRLFRQVKYHEPVRLNDRVSAIYHDAGHVLGSAFLEINVDEDGQRRRLVFSGDIGQRDKPLIRDPEKLADADFVVMESTYGDRDHDHSRSIPDALADEINAGLRAGGNILIPTFAIERAQELLFYLGALRREKRIPACPAFLDSPMALDATDLFMDHQEDLDEGGQALFRGPGLRFPGLHLCRTREQSQAINSIKGGAIIMAGSGMCTGGRIKHHLAHHIYNPRSTVLFVGYQADGTLGRQILDGAPKVRILGEMQEVKARIRRISGMSAHADRSALIDWLSAFKEPPARVFLTHGEEAVSLALGEELRGRGLPHVAVPEYLESTRLA